MHLDFDHSSEILLSAILYELWTEKYVGCGNHILNRATGFNGDCCLVLCNQLGVTNQNKQ